MLPAMGATVRAQPRAENHPDVLLTSWESDARSRDHDGSVDPYQREGFATVRAHTTAGLWYAAPRTGCTPHALPLHRCGSVEFGFDIRLLDRS